LILFSYSKSGILNKSLIEKIAQRQFNDLEWQLSQSKPKDFLKLDAQLRQQIVAYLFSEWLKKQIQQVKFNLQLE